MGNNCVNYIVLAESELIILLKSDDKRAFEQLYNNYKVRLYRNILKIVKTEEQAGKLLQEVFVKIWIDRGNLDPRKPFRNQLFKTAENLVYEVFQQAALNKTLQNYFITTATGNKIERHIYRNGDTDGLFKAIDLS
jgi:DNA-directed RNA polymerase specialized sigma24 family protein